MKMTRWQPYTDLDIHLSPWEDLFNSLAFAGGRFGPLSQPDVALFETSDSVIVEVHQPNIDPRNIHVDVTPTTLTFSGEQQHQQSNGKSRSISYQHFQRTLTIPIPVRDDQIQLHTHQDQLQIILPKIHAVPIVQGQDSWVASRRFKKVEEPTSNLSNWIDNQGRRLNVGWSRTKQWLGSQLHKVADQLLEQ